MDNAATTPVLPEAAQAALYMMQQEFGNPSSQHSLGIRASDALKEARRQVASVLHAQPGEIYFTSGGTEGINTAIFGAVQKQNRWGKHIVSTAMEHAATLNSLKKLEQQGYEVTYLQPDSTGHIREEDWKAALREDTILFTCMLVNNEVGSLLPVAEIGKYLKKKCPHALYHIDAVQGLFRLPLTPAKWNCDFMSVSGHKIGAPKGIGALYCKCNISPLLYGGGQENGFRPGTEPMPNIAAFGVACKTRKQSFEQDIRHIDDVCSYFKNKLAERIPFACLNGKNDVPHVVSVSIEGCKSEVMLRMLEMKEVYVSAGSACAKGRGSHVLQAMGLSKDRVDTALRVSFAPFNTYKDIDALMDALLGGIHRLRK